MLGVARTALLCVSCLILASLRCEAAPMDDAALTEARSLIDAGRYDEAEAVAEGLIDSAPPEEGSQFAKALALDLWVEARWRNGRAWHAGTLEAARWAVKLKTGDLGASSPEVADSLLHQARVLDEWGRFEEARALYEQALDIYRATIGTGNVRAALARVYLGGLLVELGQLRAARPYLEEGVETLESRLGIDHAHLAAGLVRFGWLEAYARNLDVGREHFARALSILEVRFGPDHPAIGEPLDGLTLVLRDLNDHEGARQAGRRAANVRVQALGADHPSLIPGLVYLWWVEDDPSRADDAMLGAKRIAESAYSANHPVASQVVADWALIASDAMLRSELWSKYERAVSAVETAYGPSHWRVGRLMANMAMNMWVLGDLERARELLERSVAIGEASEVRGSHGMLLDVRTRLLVEMGLVDPEKAILAGEYAVEIARKERSRWFYIASLLENQARRLMLSGRLREAAEIQEEALALREGYAGPDHLHLGDTLRRLAEIRARLGDFDSAGELNRRSLAIHQAGADWRLETLSNLEFEARLLWATGQIEAAADVALRLEADRSKMVRIALLGLPERQSLSLSAREPSGRDLLLSAAIVSAHSTTVLDAADTIVRSRGVILDDLAQRSAVAKVQRDAEMIRLDQALTRAREHLAHLVVGGETEGDGGSLDASIRQAIRERDRAELELVARSGQFRRQREARSIGLAETRAALPERSGLLSYMRFNLYEPTADGESPDWPLEPTPSYLAMVLRADREEPLFLDMGPAEKIEAEVSDLRQGVWRLAAAGDRAPGLSLAEYRRGGEALRARLWDPVVPALEGLERVFIVSDGELLLLHLGALPAPDGRYLIEQPLRLHYLSSERDIAGLTDREDAPTGLLAIGDPAFSETGLYAALAGEDREILRMARMDIEAQGPVLRGQRSACASFSEMQFEELPHSASELQVRRGLVGSFGGGAPPPLLLSRAAANEAAFKAEGARQDCYPSRNPRILSGRRLSIRG